MNSDPSRRRRPRRSLLSESRDLPAIEPAAPVAGGSLADGSSQPPPRNPAPITETPKPKETLLGIGPQGNANTAPFDPDSPQAPAPTAKAIRLTASEAPVRRKGRRVLPSVVHEQSSSGEPGLPLDAKPYSLFEEEPPNGGLTRSGAKIPWRRILLWLLLAVAAATLVAGVGLFVTVRRYAEDLPSVEVLKAGYNPPQITRIVARDDTLLAAEFTERRTVVPFEQIPNSAKLAFLAAEDASFYEHEGINYLGLARALFANLKAGRTVQGGSTITQQVVKNVLLDSSRSVRRKVREFLLAYRLEQSLSKDDIFWLYLNHIYLGHARYGIEEAARYYFGKHARELGLDEAAILAGVIASPEHYSPRRDAEKALKRRRFVMDQMLRKGFVTQSVHDQVLQMPLRLAPNTESESRLAPEIVHTTRSVISEVLGGGQNVGGYTVRTTIDPELQAAGRQALRANLDRYMDRHKLLPPYKSTEIKAWGAPFQGQPRRHKVYVGVVEKTDDLSGVIDVRVGGVLGQIALSTEARYNPTGLSPSEFATPGAVLRVSLQEDPAEDSKPNLRLELGPQSALVAIDVRSREVLANVGSYEALSGGLDRVTQMKRQPGSSFKPILYSYALHSRRFSPASVISVKHSGHGVAGDGPLRIDLRTAVAHSNNEAATHVLQEVGPQNVVQWSRALGIQSPMQPDLSLALGSYEVTPLELLNAYVTFAAGGSFEAPRFVERLTAADGTEAALPKSPPSTAVLTSEEAYLTTSVLRSVIEVGTGRSASRLDREVAGKTGTTNDAKDAWFVGYSTDIACAVWVGYDDGLPLGKQESGALTALPGWIDFMAAAHKNRPHTRFVRPSSILTIHVDPTTGLLAAPGQEQTRLEEFLPGTEPTEMEQFDEPDLKVPLLPSSLSSPAPPPF